MGLEPGAIMAAYDRNVARQSDEALAADIVFTVVYDYAESDEFKSLSGGFRGTPSELLRTLEDCGVAKGHIIRAPSGSIVTAGWPSVANKLTHRLNLIKSDLGEMGIEYLSHDKARPRQVTLRRLGP